MPLSRANRAGNRLAQEAASQNAKRLGLGRRDFLVSACGAASALLAFDAANAAAGKPGGFFDLEPEAALEPQLAQARVGGKGEFIFDVQGHFVDPTGTWVKTAPADAFKWSPKAACGLAAKPGARSYLDCLGPEEFVKDVFLDSDTDMMVLSFVPSRRDSEPLTIQAADAVRRIVDSMEGTHRLLLHGRVNPNQPGDLEAMDELKERWKVCAWKTYTQWGPDGKGFFLSDDVGTRFIEKARALGVKMICVHKGLPFGKQSYEHSQCSDIGVVAKRFPDVNFLIYHSGFVTGVPERAYAGRGRATASIPSSVHCWRTASNRTATCMPSSAAPGASSCANPTARRMRWASSSSTAARTTCSGAPTRSGTARRRTRSRRFALSRSPRTARAVRLRRDHAGAARENLRPERGSGLRDQHRRSEKAHSSGRSSPASVSPTASIRSRIISPTGPRPGVNS